MKLPRPTPITLTPRHPLHTQDFVDRLNATTPGGYAAHMTRRTGRTTAIALEAISKAIRSPGTTLYFEDHHPGQAAARNLASLIRDVAERLRLSEINVTTKAGRVELRFGEQTKTLAEQMRDKFNLATATTTTAHRIKQEMAALERALADQKDSMAAQEIRDALELLGGYLQQCPTSRPEAFDFAPSRYLDVPTKEFTPAIEHLTNALKACIGQQVTDQLCDAILADAASITMNDRYAIASFRALRYVWSHFLPIAGKGFQVDGVIAQFDGEEFSVDIRLCQPAREFAIELEPKEAERRTPPIRLTSIKGQGGITLRAQAEKGGRKISAQAILPAERLTSARNPAALIRATYRSLRDSVRITAEAYPE